MRIQDKLTHNGDHFLTESFKIVYVITRLGGEAAGSTSLRRRQRLYSSVSDLLSHLSDSYEKSLSMVQQEYRHAYGKLKQQDKQPFSEFYIEFMKYAEHKHAYGTPETIVKQHITLDLQDRIGSRLRKVIVESGKRNWTITELKECLTELDYYQRMAAKDKIRR